MEFNSITLQEAKKAQLKTHPAFTVLMTIVLFMVASFMMFIPITIIKIIRAISGQETSIGLDDMGWQLNILLIIVILTFIFYCRKVENRSPRSMGFTRKGIVPQYLQGAFLGWFMFSLSLGICVMIGAMEYKGMVMTASWGMILLWLFSFMIQGMSEEVMCRGFLMVSLSNRMPMAWAIFISSVLFSVLHIFNDSISALAILNLTLYGVFAALYFLYTDNIWAVSAHHAFWNWTQGNLYGIEVSGGKLNDTVWSFVPTAGNDLLNGGSFGLEGGLIETMVLTAAIACLLLISKKKGNKFSNNDSIP
jgi:Predicted metal-dependent membrane protease